MHTEGQVNKKYLSNVDKKFTKDLKEGERLVCDEIYIDNAIKVLTKVVFSITYELLVSRKADKEIIGSIADIFFERLKEKDYELTSYVYYALSQYKELEFYDRTMYRINYINSVKQLGDKETLQKELKGLDVSIGTDKFKIAKLCLADDNKQVFELLKKSYPESFNAIAVREWPIFINFRNTDYYKQFVALHSSDFEIEEIEM